MEDAITFLRRDDIVGSQKSIEQFLLALQKSDPALRRVFVEGYTEKDVKHIENLKKLDTLLKTRQVFQTAHPAVLRYLVNYYFSTSEKLARAYSPQSKIAYGFDYIAMKKIRQVLDYFESNPPALSSEDADDFAYEEGRARDLLSGAYLFGGKHALLGDDSPYLMGAAVKMYLDENMDTISPTSTSSSVEAASAELDKVRKLQQQIIELKGIDLKKRLSLVLQQIALNKSFDAKVLKEREKTAINFIAHADNSDHAGLIPLVYGDMHHFESGLREHNRTNSDSSLGLIEIRQI
ncbi:MAG: hypothetical protein M1366_06640 [Patescibacteria group bacterium]|nr:hypothetical protein [Patescibacteria group bacterium]